MLNFITWSLRKFSAAALPDRNRCPGGIACDDFCRKVSMHPRIALADAVNGFGFSKYARCANDRLRVPRRTGETKMKGRNQKAQRPTRKKSGCKADCRALRAKFPRAASTRRLRRRCRAAQKTRPATGTARSARKKFPGLRSSQITASASLAILSAKALFAKANLVRAIIHS